MFNVEQAAKAPMLGEQSERVKRATEQKNQINFTQCTIYALSNL